MDYIIWCVFLYLEISSIIYNEEHINKDYTFLLIFSNSKKDIKKLYKIQNIFIFFKYKIIYKNV